VKLMGAIVASIGIMLATTWVLLWLKVLAVGAVAGWSWWAVTAPLWGPWLVVTIAGFCVGCHVLLVRLERVAV
jgi:hypothetical protein